MTSDFELYQQHAVKLSLGVGEVTPTPCHQCGGELYLKGLSIMKNGVFLECECADCTTRSVAFFDARERTKKGRVPIYALVDSRTPIGEAASAGN